MSGFLNTLLASYKGKLSWTFTLSSLYDESYTGHLGTQSFGNGGLADGVNTGNSSVSGTDPEVEPFITADFGSVVYINTVFMRAIPVSFDGWGSSYMNKPTHFLRYSVDGSEWVTIAAGDSWASLDLDLVSVPAGLFCRYIKLTSSIEDFVGLSEFYFT